MSANLMPDLLPHYLRNNALSQADLTDYKDGLDILHRHQHLLCR